MSKYLERVLPFFPDAFITHNNELVLVPKINVYFLLENVETDNDFDCKMIEYCSRPAHKGVSKYWQRYVRRGLNSYFRKNWNDEELSIMYTYMGCGVNRGLVREFIKREFDLSILTDEEEMKQLREILRSRSNASNY